MQLKNSTLEYPRPTNIADFRKVIALMRDENVDLNARLAAVERHAIADYGAPYTIFLMTGDALVGAKYEAIISSLANDQVDPKLKAILRSQAIAGIERRRDGLELFCRDEESRDSLYPLMVRLLGGSFRFKQRDPLHDLYYIDVLGMNAKTSLIDFQRALMNAGLPVVWTAPRVRDTAAHAACPTVRVHFATKTPPEKLFVKDAYPDQLLHDDRFYTVMCKQRPLDVFPARNTRSPHCLVLDKGAKGGEDDDVESVVSNEGEDMPPCDDSADGDVSMGEPTAQSSSLAQALEADDKQQFAEWSRCCRKKHVYHAQPTMTDVNDTKPWFGKGRYEVLGDLDMQLDAVEWSCPGEKRPTRLRYEPLVQGEPPAGNGDAPCCGVTVESTDPTDPTKRHVVAEEISAATLARRARLAMKTSTKATRQTESDESILQTAITHSKLETAKLGGAVPAIREQPLAATFTLMNWWLKNDSTMDNLRDLHMLHRSIVADNVSAIVPLDQHMERLDLHTLTRDDLLTIASSKKIAHKESLTLNRALAAFELFLIATAPNIFKNDECLTLLLGEHVMWLPAEPIRLLHPSTLLAVARSELGRDLLKRVQRLNTERSDLAWLADKIDDEAWVRDQYQSDITLALIKQDDGYGWNLMSGLQMSL